MTKDDPVCCGGSREVVGSSGGAPDRSRDAKPSRQRPKAPSTDGMVRLDSGPFMMDTDDDVGFPADGEGPVREVRLDPFSIDTEAVTNAELLEFVRATGYTTDAERYGWSFVFQDFIAPADRAHVLDHVAEAPWWKAVEGATWLRPYSPSSNMWLGGKAVPVGRRADAGRRPSLQHLAGGVPRAKHRGGWLRTNGARGRVRTERLRPAQPRRQRVGVVCRLVQCGVSHDGGVRRR